MTESPDTDMLILPAEGIRPGVRVRVRPSGEPHDPFVGQTGTVAWQRRIRGIGAVLCVRFDTPHLRSAVLSFDEVDRIE